MDENLIFAFVLMPFAREFDDVYNIGIKEAAIQVEVTAQRLDEQLFAEGMMERIYRQIEAADIIVADLSEKNANVFYELGYAHAKDKLCILLTTDAKDIPFDLKHHRHIVYKGSLTYLRDELAKNLSWAKSEIENIRKSQIRISLKPQTGTLTTNQYEATASVAFRVDLFNDSTKSSAEINAIYFYTGKMWKVTQGGKECPYTEADIPRYNYRFFLAPPVARLLKNSWAQLQFTTTKVMAETFWGEEIKNEYKLTGTAILRFVTSEGIFDHEININLEVSEFPF